MTAHLLTQRRVSKPWGRHDLWDGFAAPGPDDEAIGEIWFEDELPAALLVKYLFTSERLSVQVHPDDAAAQAAGHPRGKAECWLILAAEPDSTVALGPRESVDRHTLHDAALDGSIVDLLDWRRVQAGDFVYSPPGTIHAIGAGITLIEVQQNVDLTYRLFDYGRPRELHLDDGLAVSVPEPYGLTFGAFMPGTMLDAPAFSVIGLDEGAAQVDGGLLVPIVGSGRIGRRAIHAGECWRLSGPCEITLAPDAKALLAVER